MTRERSISPCRSPSAAGGRWVSPAAGRCVRARNGGFPRFPSIPHAPPRIAPRIAPIYANDAVSRVGRCAATRQTSTGCYQIVPVGSQVGQILHVAVDKLLLTIKVPEGWWRTAAHAATG